MTVAALVRLPKITPELRERFGADVRLIDNDANWTPEALDFACEVASPAIREEIEELTAALAALVGAVARMKVPQTLPEAALQVNVTLGPALLAAQAVLWDRARARARRGKTA